MMEIKGQPCPRCEYLHRCLSLGTRGCHRLFFVSLDDSISKHNFRHRHPEPVLVMNTRLLANFLIDFALERGRNLRAQPKWMTVEYLIGFIVGVAIGIMLAGAFLAWFGYFSCNL